MTSYAPGQTIPIARQADYGSSLQEVRALLHEGGHTVLAQCAAWTACVPAWRAVYAHGDRVLIGHSICRFGTVVGYSLKTGLDPVAALDNARERGHNTHWLSLESVSLTNGPTIEHDILYRHQVGDQVTLEGRTFTIAPAPNRNFSLVPMETD